MKQFLKNQSRWGWLIIMMVMIGGIALVWLGLRQTVTVIVDGQPITVKTASLTIPGTLRAAGLFVRPEDQIFPSETGVFWDQGVIRVQTARQVLIQTPEDELSVITAESVPANILSTMSIDLFPQDQLLVNGIPVDPALPINQRGSILIQYEPANRLEVVIGDQNQILYTNQATLGAALEAASIYLGTHDWISADLSAAVHDSMSVEIRRARMLTIQTATESINGMTAATTVGEALQDLGYPLQNLDYSVPSEDDFIPTDSTIKIIQARESLAIATEEIPYESDYQEDPETALDQLSVIQEGQNAVFANRERIKFEDGVEVWRSPQESWQASEAEKGILGYGTKIQIQTAVVDGQTIEYWRKISVYATSYKPCDANGVCYDGTAGGYPLQQGIIAVSPHWYSVPNGLGMADLSVYVPGYGRAIIGDVCGGCSGSYWIDLAYRDENYIPWHNWTIMYFLTPVPQRYIPPIITP